MSTSKQLGWIAVGTVTGGAVGVAWGWFGSGGYDANDSMIGTGFLCALLGALLTAVFVTVLRRRHGRRHGQDR
jgi:drug/metabolite transporter (DMT)-like permease